MGHCMSSLNEADTFQSLRRRVRGPRDAQFSKLLQEDQLREQLSDVEQDRDQLTAQLILLQDQLSDVQRDKDHLTAQLIVLQEERDQLSDVQQDRDQLRDQLSDVQRDKDHLTAQLIVLQEERDQLSDVQQDRDQLRDQLRELQQNRNPSHDWVINRKEIQITDQELGRGAWGFVYLGRFHGCEVAVKQMYDEILSDHNRRLFEREVDIASKCRHPCLLQFIGATADNQTPLLVTELMECSLRKRLSSITVEDVTVISLDVARALNYLHQFKPSPIIHHDVSSANVLLRRLHNQWQAKLSDYGTANFVRQNNNNYAGAPIYRAPESITEDPDRPISVKVDVYSFGVLLCEMCIRQDPDLERRREQIRQMRESRFRNLVKRCIRDNPWMRPDMDTIIEQLESLKVQQPRMARTGRLACS